MTPLRYVILVVFILVRVSSAPCLRFDPVAAGGSRNSSRTIFFLSPTASSRSLSPPLSI